MYIGYCECDSMDDVGNGRMETGNNMADRVPGYPGLEPDGYPVPKIPESPSTSLDCVSTHFQAVACHCVS